MFKERAYGFHEYVWSVARRIGMAAPRVTDEVIRDLFPRTKEASVDEGADHMFRTGVMDAIRRVFKASGLHSEHQLDFADIDERFRTLASKLKNAAYYVPSKDEHVFVHGLIDDPEQLDEARRFMRKKGLECLAEADLLDELYEAVTAMADA